MRSVLCLAWLAAAACTDTVDFSFPGRESAGPITELLAVRSKGATSIYAAPAGETWHIPGRFEEADTIALAALLYRGSPEDNGFAAGELGSLPPAIDGDFYYPHLGAFTATVSGGEASEWESLEGEAVPAELRAHRLHARRATQLAFGNSSGHACAVYEDGGARCWGDNNYTQSGGDGPVLVAPRDEPIARNITAIAIGAWHTCLLSADERVACFGANDRGQLARDSLPSSSAEPVEVQGLDRVVQIDSGFGWTCALDRDGVIACWGTTGPSDPRGTALGNVDLGARVEKIAVSSLSVCGLVAGRLHCAGVNVCDLLPGTTVAVGEWDRVELELPAPVIDVKMGDTYGCALLDTSELYCWGCNGKGQASFPDNPNTVPTPKLAASGVRHFELGASHTCVIDTAGELWCWGEDRDGMLGDGAPALEQSAPVRVRDVDDAVQIAVHQFHNCALHEDGDISCWGRNDRSQLGSGAQTEREPAPLRVERVRRLE